MAIGEDAELCRGTEQQALRVGNQRAEVGHGTYAHEDQGRVQAGLDADVEDIQQAAVMDNVREAELARDVGVPELGVIHLGAREVGEQHAEGDTDQQQRLKLLYQPQIQQHAGDRDHQDLTPVVEQHVEAGGLTKTAKRFQYTHRPFLRLRAAHRRWPQPRPYWRQSASRRRRRERRPRSPSSWPR